MPRKDDIRFDQRPVKVEHQSARGETFRNIGAYARGSQLKIMAYKLLLVGMEPPVLVAACSFLALLILLLALFMREHEVQLVEMRCFAGLWQLVGFDASHIINVTLTDGSVEPMEVGDVATYPEVARAVTKFVRCIVVSLAGSATLTVPLTTWFIKVSRKTSAEALEERHERGSTLVSTEVLCQEIAAFNRGEFRAELATRHPGYDPEKVMSASIAEQIALGLHVPYVIAGVPYPWRFEQTHAMLIGSTGTGKTTILKSIVAQARERGHRCVIFDLTGAFVQAFYREGTDVVLNTMDERCPPWTLFDECENYADFISAAAALIPGGDGGGEDPFWVTAARTLFVEMCAKLVAKGHKTNAAIVHELMTADLEALCSALEGSIAAPLVNPKAPRLAESVRAVFNTNALAMRFLPDPVPAGPPPFSIRDWVSEGEPGSILFITSVHRDLELNRTLLTLWVDLAVNSLMTLGQGRDLRMWFLFDEVHALHRLKAIEHGLQTARSFGGAFVLGMHSFDKLAETYGEKGAHNLGALARTKVILSTGDRNTAKFCSEIIGEHEVREIDEAYSIGANRSRDAATLTPRTSMKPLMIADDLVDLQSLTGLVKFPEGFPAGHITIRWVDYPAIAAPYVRRTSMPITGLLKTGALEDQSEPADSGPQMPVEVDREIGIPPELSAAANVIQPDLFAHADQRAAMPPGIEPPLAKPETAPAGGAGSNVEPVKQSSFVLDSFRLQRDNRAAQDSDRSLTSTGSLTPESIDRACKLGPSSGPRVVQQIVTEELTGQAYADPSERKAHHPAPGPERDDHGRDDDGMEMDH